MPHPQVICEEDLCKADTCGCLQCCCGFTMLLLFYNVTMVLQCCYGFIMLLSFHPYCKVQLCKNMGNYFLGVMGVVTFGELKECLDTRHFL